MPSIFRVEARLNYTSGLPEDCAVNTFHFYSSDDTFAAADASDRIVSFYNDVHTPGTNDLAYYLSPVISRTANAMENFVYEVGVEGPPIYYDTWTLDAAQTSQKQLPFEVALCASYSGNVSGVPSARQRGRIFIGPLMENALQASGIPPSPTSGLRDAAVGACDDLATEATNAAAWCVYSRVGNIATPISHGWVDNEFDTQRRRQQRASTRTTWTA